ncbi:NAD(P)/FAD-dependent oxidoreductase [Millisia brevis]|uniref:NAD(P)/FAD-dependent oxidoreductase n=1 Tax=Millisia brevis TaxID=264148 RepID=UPI0008299107|nr:FAD-binding oxidoreductase [Millisia brevis]
MTIGADVVVIGAGAVGAACAYFASAAGLRVHVVERGPIVAGTSSACEGNLLVSDKEAGPELDLARYSREVFTGELAPFARLWEFEHKGGLVVTRTPRGAEALTARAREQRETGIEVTDVVGADLADYEPHLSPAMLAGAYYPEDSQVQPMLLAAHLLRLARERGAIVSTHTEVHGFRRRGDAVNGVRTSRGDIDAAAVINAAGTWAGRVAELAGVAVPVLPRKGFVLVTEPLPPRTIRHKVYDGEYVANVLSSEEGLQTSPVVEGTDAGTVLIGSSRERVGFDRTVSLPVMARMATQAAALFPRLASARIMRSYFGFRPYCPDHLPVIGADPRAPGLWHATGHEGAGIGLSAGTAKALVAALTGAPAAIDLTPFAPERFGDNVIREAAHVG